MDHTNDTAVYISGRTLSEQRKIFNEHIKNYKPTHKMENNTEKTDTVVFSIKDISGKISVYTLTSTKEFADEMAQQILKEKDNIIGITIWPIVLNKVFEEIQSKLKRQNEKWGQQNWPSLSQELEGLGPMLRCLNLALPDEKTIKTLVDNEYKEGKSHWSTIALEEMVEVVCAPNEYERREELLDLIGVLVQWVDSIDRNGTAIEPQIENEVFTPSTVMSFGPHKGKKLGNVPAEWLLFCLSDNLVDGHLKDYIINHKDELTKKARGW